MDAKQCDRCGKYFTPSFNDAVGVIPFTDEKYNLTPYIFKERKDLCPDCIKSYNDWLNSSKQELHKCSKCGSDNLVVTGFTLQTEKEVIDGRAHYCLDCGHGELED